MRNPGLTEALWSMLDGRLWHATKRDCLIGIISDIEISVGVGHEYENSFCRSEGSVCLFDFGPTARDYPNQFHNWCGWFGHRQCVRTAVWLEIDRDRVKSNLSDAETSHDIWEETRSKRSKRFIPGVEACHKGPIPIAAVIGALLIDRYD